MRRHVFVACLVIGAVAAHAETAQLSDELQAGLGYAYNVVNGRLSGFTTGVGTLDEKNADSYSLAGSVPFHSVNFDLSVGYLDYDSIARGAFSFKGLFYANGANVSTRLTDMDLVARWRVLEKQAMRISFLVGARVLDTRIRTHTTTQAKQLDTTFLLPEVGGILEVHVYPRSTLYGLFKYGDITSERGGSFLLQAEGGLSYLLPAPTDAYIGWRVTAGVRYLDRGVTDAIGRTDQIKFDYEAGGPFVEASRVF